MATLLLDNLSMIIPTFSRHLMLSTGKVDP